MQNDQELAQQYGRNIRLFQKNRAKVDSEQLAYRFVKLSDTEPEDRCGHLVLLTIQNPCELKIRPEKQIAEAFGLSRSQVQKLMLQGKIKLESIASRNQSSLIQPLPPTPYRSEQCALRLLPYSC